MPFRGVVRRCDDRFSPVFKRGNSGIVSFLMLVFSMRHALGIVYGANMGTTMTGWLAAVVGVKPNIQFLPMIGVGMILNY